MGIGYAALGGYNVGGIEMINIDEMPENQDWVKQTWDLPPYKSEEFLREINDLVAFRKLPVYKFAVQIGLIKDDRWVGKRGAKIEK